MARIFASLLFVLLTGPNAFAGLYGEVGGFFSSDTFTTSSDSTDARTYFSLDLIASLDNKQRFYAGFHVHQLSINTETEEKSEYSTLDMGPMLMWVIDQKKNFSLTVGYNVTAQATLNNGDATSDLTGTSLMASVGIMPEVADDLYLGVRINYYNATYSRETIDGATEDVSYSRSIIFPTFVISWRR